MNFERFISNIFFGQTTRIRELSYIAEEVIAGNNRNILFIARSGMGKTVLAQLFLAYVDREVKNSAYLLPTPKGLSIPEDKRNVFIDEIHLLDTPEVLYPLLDSGRKTILLATNEFYQLKEPLVNRCTVIHFSPYTFDEQITMVKMFFKNKGKMLPYNICKEIVPYGRDVPRELLVLCERLHTIFKYDGVPQTDLDLQLLLYNVLSLSKGGFSELDRRYIEFLATTRDKTASLALIASATGISRQEIREYIEPFLIKSGYLAITSKGRTLLKE